MSFSLGVIGAKYRSARPGALDSMVSAHLYRDCLCWNGLCPDRALLLVPRGGGAPFLQSAEYQEENRVGVTVLGDESNGLLAMLQSLGISHSDLDLPSLESAGEVFPPQACG